MTKDDNQQEVQKADEPVKRPRRIRLSETKKGATKKAAAEVDWLCRLVFSQLKYRG